MEDLQRHIRPEQAPDDATAVVRGGNDGLEKLRRHVERTHRAYALKGTPIYGLSVYCALDELSERALGRRLTTYAVVRRSTVGRLRSAGFELIPTFSRPHFTIVLRTAEPEELLRLLACFDPPSDNPRQEGRRGGRERRVGDGRGRHPGRPE